MFANSLLNLIRSKVPLYTPDPNFTQWIGTVNDSGKSLVLDGLFPRTITGLIDFGTLVPDYKIRAQFALPKSFPHLSSSVINSGPLNAYFPIIDQYSEYCKCNRLIAPDGSGRPIVSDYATLTSEAFAHDNHQVICELGPMTTPALRLYCQSPSYVKLRDDLVDGQTYSVTLQIDKQFPSNNPVWAGGIFADKKSPAPLLVVKSSDEFHVIPFDDDGYDYQYGLIPTTNEISQQPTDRYIVIYGMTQQSYQRIQPLFNLVGYIGENLKQYINIHQYPIQTQFGTFTRVPDSDLLFDQIRSSITQSTLSYWIQRFKAPDTITSFDQLHQWIADGTDSYIISVYMNLLENVVQTYANSHQESLNTLNVFPAIYDVVEIYKINDNEPWLFATETN